MVMVIQRKTLQGGKLKRDIECIGMAVQTLTCKYVVLCARKLWMELLQTYDNDNNNLSLSSCHIDMCVQHVSKGVNTLFYVACCMILSVAWISIIFARWSCKRYVTTWFITTICTSSSLCILKHNIYPMCHTHSITLKIYSVILH